jgi:hypothetical protein
MINLLHNMTNTQTRDKKNKRMSNNSMILIDELFNIMQVVL